MTNTPLVIELTILVLAIFLGFEVISKVPTMLHTPLMSGTNFIHGIVIVGAIVVLGFADDGTTKAIGFVAMERGAAAPPPRPGRRVRSGGDPDGVAAAEADELFAMQLRYLIDGIARDAVSVQPAPTKRGTKR